MATTKSFEQDYQHQVAVVQALLNDSLNLDVYDKRIADKEAMIDRLVNEIAEIRVQKSNVPNALKLAQIKLKAMSAERRIANNPSLAKLVALRAKVAAMEAELGEQGSS